MKNKGSLFTVFLAVLIDLMGFGIVLPLLPFYATSFHASPVTIGLLYSVYSFSQLIFSPIWGSFSDRIGRRPIMLLSTLGASLAYLLFGFSRSLTVLFISRILAGIMGGNISTAQAYVADITTHEDRARGMGLIGAAFGIGFVMGPALSSLLIHPRFLSMMHINETSRFLLPGLFAALLSFISFLLVLFKLPESVKTTGQTADNLRVLKTSIFSKNFWRSIFQHRPGRPKYLFPLLILSAFLLSFAQASMYSSFPLFCKERLGLRPDKVGMQFVFMGLIAVIIQGGMIRPLTKRFAEKNLFLLGNVLMLSGFILLPFAQAPSMLTLYLGIMAVGSSLNQPTLTSLISKEADPSKMGATLGTSQGIAGMGRVIGPTWGGYLYQISFRLPFLATASLLFLAIYAGIRVLQAEQTIPSQK